MQQELLLNSVPSKAPVQEAEFAFYTSKQDGYYPIHIDGLKGVIEGLINENETGEW